MTQENDCAGDVAGRLSANFLHPQCNEYKEMLFGLEKSCWLMLELR